MIKKSKRKRVICTVLAGLMLAVSSGCGGEKVAEELPEVEEESLEVTAGTPVYEDDAYIELAAYCGPRRGGYRYWNGVYGEYEQDPAGGWDGWITKEAFQDYIDCGFTYLLTEQDAAYDYNYQKEQSVSEFEKSDLYPYMELAEEMNIPVVVYANNLTQMTGSTDPRLTEDQKAFLAEMVADLSQYKMFKGFTFRDEPSIGSAKTFGAVKEYLDSLKSDLYYFTSFLPIYCNDLTRLSTEHTDDKEAAYTDYINAFSDAVGTFSYDSYPLYTDPVKGTTFVDDTWFQNLRIVAENAKEKDYDAGITIQSFAGGNAGAEGLSVHKRATDSKADITFQLYTSLAYGMKYINYYTYWEHWAQSDTESYYSSMVMYPEENGQEPIKTDAYYAVKEANEEIKKFDHVFMKFDWLGTTALTSEDKDLTTALKLAGDYQSPRIASAAATDDAIIGCMKDADGYDGYMIVNATDPGQKLSNTVTVEFKETSKVLAYINGEEQTVTPEDGKYTFELEAGAGVFVIPIQ